ADAKGPPNTRRVEVSSSNAVALFPGSLYVMSGGKLVSVANSAGNATEVAGAVISLYNTDGCSVQNLPAGTAGWAEVTFEANQEYVVTVDDDAVADNGSDNGTMFNVTDETGVANANGTDGTPYSTRKLDGSTGNADTRMFIASRKTGTPGNMGGPSVANVK